MIHYRSRRIEFAGAFPKVYHYEHFVKDAYIKEAVEVDMWAKGQGVARLKLSRQELHDRAEFMINRSRSLTEKMIVDIKKFQ